jgi:DNA-binding LacI/PurR family transcriptional regulator
MQLPHYDLGRKAVECLLAPAGSVEPNAVIHLPCPLIRRHSV